jgi:hypothetical protein
LSVNSLQEVTIIQELRTSIHLLVSGLSEIQNLTYTRNFNLIAFHLLSQGFERLLKLHICLGYLADNGRLPSYEYIKKFSHELIGLRDEVMKSYFEVDNLQSKLDYEFIINDSELCNLFSILSKFGSKTRYYNLNVITDSNLTDEDPVIEWGKFVGKFLQSKKDLISKIQDTTEAVKFEDQLIAKYIVTIFEKMIIPIGRQFCWGKLRYVANCYNAQLFDLILLDEKDYGKRDYSEFRKKLY